MRSSHRRGDRVAHAVERLEPRHLLAASLLVDINRTTGPSNAYILASRFGQALAPGAAARGLDESDPGTKRPLDDLLD